MPPNLKLKVQQIKSFNLTKTMISHPINLHIGPHITENPSNLTKFSNQFISHLNTILSDTIRRFKLNSIDQSIIPQPEVQMGLFPDQHNIEIYLFDPIPHPTRNGSWTVKTNGDVILVAPCSKLQFLDKPDFDIYLYSRLLSTIIHEFEHSRGKRGEGYFTLNADSNGLIDIPPINIWNYPYDIYWNNDKKLIIKDPFYISTLNGHPLFGPETQDFNWLLQNSRPCPGNIAILNGNYRENVPWSKSFIINCKSNDANLPRAKVKAWSIPRYYQDSWVQIEDGETDTSGKFTCNWSDQEYNNPLTAIKVELNGFPTCVGYISIFELEWLGITNTEPIIRADMNTGLITVPFIDWESILPPKEVVIPELEPVIKPTVKPTVTVHSSSFTSHSSPSSSPKKSKTSSSAKPTIKFNNKNSHIWIPDCDNCR